MCKYTTIFTIVDDFCKTYQDWIRYKLLTTDKQRIREGKLSLSEAISIMIFYHFSPYKNLKTYYQHFVMGSNLFSNPPCYDRFIQIIPSLFLPLIIMMHYISGNKQEFIMLIRRILQYVKTLEFLIIEHLLV